MIKGLLVMVRGSYCVDKWYRMARNEIMWLKVHRWVLLYDVNLRGIAEAGHPMKGTQSITLTQKMVSDRKSVLINVFRK